MNRKSWTAVLALAFTFGVLAPAPAADAGEGQPIRVARVAVVQIEKVFNDYEYVKDCKTDIEGRFRPRRDEIENLRRQYEAEVQRVQQDPLLRPGTPEFEKKRVELQLMEMNIRTQQESLAKDVNRENSSVLVRFYDAFRTASQLACNHYQVDILLTATDPNLPDEARREGVPAPALMQDIVRRIVQYHRADVDVTGGVLFFLNSAYQAHKADRTRPMFPVAPR